MKNGIKAIQIILLALAFAIFFGKTNSYAFTVKDGENVIESPDDSRWIQRTGVYFDGRYLIINIFNGNNAQNGLSVTLSKEDLKNASERPPFSGEIKMYFFAYNTSISAELTKEDDALIFKDYTCTLTNTGTEIPSENIKGGDFNPSEYEESDFEYDGNYDEVIPLSDIMLFYTNRYHEVFGKLLVTYEPSEETPEDNPSENGETTETGDPVNPSEPEENHEDPVVETPPTPEPKPSPAPAPTPTPAPEPTPEPKPEEEDKVTVPEREIVKEPEKKQEPIQEAKLSETPAPKRIETTIIGEELKYKVSAVIPAGVDERVVSKLQKQISDTVDDLLQEINEDPSSAKERVSEETYSNIERALSEGKTIFAEVSVESTEKESVPESDLEVLDSVAEDNKETNLKIGRYFNISIMIKADDGEELGTYNEMTETLVFTLPKPKDVPCPPGMEYVVVRIHNGVASLIPVTVNNDGSISFETDRFSTYALAVREVMDEETAKASGIMDEGGNDEGLMDFAKWFLRILAFAFASGTIVILMGLHDKKKNK